MVTPNALLFHPAANDWVTIKEAVALLEKTGHPVSEPTIRRWIAEEELPLKRVGRGDQVSYSDILMSHACWVTSREN